MNEFSLIRTVFAPLANNFPGSLNLTDDAAILAPRQGYELIVTTDAMSSGIHFIGNESPALIARKLLRTNLSDLAAMGAAPLCYFLSIMAPKVTPPEWFQSFADGLAIDQKQFNLHLAGGDTTATNSPLCLSITLLGELPTGTALRRNGAKPGDAIYVSGTLGDSALGLASLRAQRSNPAALRLQRDSNDTAPTALPLDRHVANAPRDDDSYLIDRYLLPQPRVTLGQELRNIASSCMDISDGLLQDMGHICAASGVGATLHRPLLPLSDAAKSLMQQTGFWEAVTSGGDDYELLFTLPPEKQSQLPPGERLTKIGEITPGNGVVLMDEQGNPLPLNHRGFQHF